jgi:Ricin-type beta-trefoil lectin domain-like
VDSKDKDKGSADKPFQKLVNRNSDKVVGVLNKSTKDGAACVQWKYAGKEPNQHWRLVPARGGWSYIENANSKTYMSVKFTYRDVNVRVGRRTVRHKRVSGADVCIGDKSANDPTQQWKLKAVPREKGWFYVLNRGGEAGGLVLTVREPSQTDGAKLILAGAQKAAKSQHWKFDKLGPE